MITCDNRLSAEFILSLRLHGKLQLCSTGSVHDSYVG